MNFSMNFMFMFNQTRNCCYYKRTIVMMTLLRLSILKTKKAAPTLNQTSMVEQKHNVNAFAGKAETKKSIWQVAVYDVGCYLPAHDLVTIVSYASAHTLMLVLPQAALQWREEVREVRPGP